ncbi:hypothetical protein ACFC0K_15990 [Streptomyces hydrogenans]|uniref:hypothetical protein n=1 Tax=Streptomyces hydrogenans TaxID=1873719 RepID=UPI0035D76199
MPARSLPANLGDNVGAIAAYTAQSLAEEFGKDAERLLARFTTPAALDFITHTYLSGLDQGQSPAKAASDAGVALIRMWAEVTLAAQEHITL